MDRGEPTLVPEWLKGISGGGTGVATSHHNHTGSSQSDNSDVPFLSRARPFQSQFSGASRSDYDSPRYSGSSDRPAHLFSRRGLNNTSGGNERTNTDKDSYSHSRAYANFRRSSSSRTSDFLEREKDWEWDREREARNREKSLGSGGNDWSVSRTRVEGESTLRRSQSVISNRNAENEAKKLGNELQSITAMAPPMRGPFVSNLQKAAFERNFPCLGAEERQGTVQTNQANVSLLNSSPSSVWQGQRSSTRSEPRRTSSPGLITSAGSLPGSGVAGISAIGVDGWKSALADAPVLNGSLQNNGPSVSVQHSGLGNLVLSKGHGLASGSGLNMAEALVQNPARPRITQLSVEVQRLEELALKQSRQLIPVTPSMPKTIGLSSSEKSKAKSLRSVDASASAVKATQSTGSSLLINSPKLNQGGKLLVLKSGKEIVSNISVKPDVASPVKGGNSGNSSFGASAGGATDLGGNMVGLRKHKLPADNRAISSSSMPALSAVDSGLGARSKEGSLVFEEKKPASQAQNRSDFFNALRRKAFESQSSSGTRDKSSPSTCDKTDEVSGKVTTTVEDTTELKDKLSSENLSKKSDIAASIVEVISKEKDKASSNGFISGKTETSIKDSSENNSPISVNNISVKVGSEEEEAAFLRSLGWEENAGGEEALTEEEIRSFYQEHMRTMVAFNAFRRGSDRFCNLKLDMHIGNNVESMPSGIGSSELA